MADKVTKVRQEQRNSSTTSQRFTVGNPSYHDDTDTQLQPAEFGINVVDGTLEIGINGKVYQIPALEANAAANTKACVWDEASKKWVFGTVGGGGVTVLSLSALAVANVVNLTTGQSPAILLFDQADGITTLLPAKVTGLNFTFITTVELTSGIYQVIAPGGNVLIGGLSSINGVTPENARIFANSPGDNAITLTGATTGGKIGTEINIIGGVANNQYIATGRNVHSGIMATPFNSQ